MTGSYKQACYRAVQEANRTRRAAHMLLRADPNTSALCSVRKSPCGTNSQHSHGVADSDACGNSQCCFWRCLCCSCMHGAAHLARLAVLLDRSVLGMQAVHVALCSLLCSARAGQQICGGADASVVAPTATSSSTVEACTSSLTTSVSRHVMPVSQLKPERRMLQTVMMPSGQLPVHLQLAHHVPACKGTDGRAVFLLMPRDCRAKMETRHVKPSDLPIASRRYSFRRQRHWYDDFLRVLQFGCAPEQHYGLAVTV